MEEKIRGYILFLRVALRRVALWMLLVWYYPILNEGAQKGSAGRLLLKMTIVRLYKAGEADRRIGKIAKCQAQISVGWAIPNFGYIKPIVAFSPNFMEEITHDPRREALNENRHGFYPAHPR